jgi:hypothetical protein
MMTPIFWVELMCQVFGTSEKFACRLWRYYDASPTFLFQIGLYDAHTKNRDLLISRARHLTELMPGASLLAASLILSPENAKARAPDCIRFEEAVLQSLDCDGRWRW